MRDTTIVGVTSRRVWTARGLPAIEAEIQLACGARGRATTTPTLGAWHAFGSANQDWRSGQVAAAAADAAPTGDTSPSATVSMINTAFSNALHGVNANRQDEVDATLARLEIGGDPWITRAARSACSIAAAQAAAHAAGVPLFRHLRAGQFARMPMPVVDVAAATSAASPFRALAIVPFAADGVDEALAVAIAIHHAASEFLGDAPSVVDEQTIESVLRAIELTGFVPAEEIGLALDVGASRIYRDGRYVCAGSALDEAGWRLRLIRTVEAYPLSAIEDPLADKTNLAHFTPFVDDRARVVGGDLFASEAEGIVAAANGGIASGVTLRPESAGTLTELRAAFAAAHRAGWPVLAAAEPAGEDASLVHIATAWQANYVKLGSVGDGSFARGNELLRIEASARPSPSALRVEAAARLVH